MRGPKEAPPLAMPLISYIKKEAYALKSEPYNYNNEKLK